MNLRIDVRIPNLVMESGVHPLLHPNCHHQTVDGKERFLFLIKLSKTYSQTK